VSVGAACGRFGADGETRTLTDGDLNAVPLPIGLRRLTPRGYGSHAVCPLAVELDETLNVSAAESDDDTSGAEASVAVQP